MATIADKIYEKLDLERVKHCMRILERTSSPFTEMDKLILQDLLQLSTSVYTEVRIKAQKVMFSCFDSFDYSARAVLPTVLEKLRDDPSITHEEFKGGLYLLLNSRMLYLVTHYWEVMVDAWPAIIQADHSEKPSMVKLIDKVVDRLNQKFDSVGLKRKVTPACCESALKLLRSEKPTPTSSFEIPVDDVSQSVLPSDDLIKKAQQRLEDGNRHNIQLYTKLVDELVGTINANNLRWRHTEICVKFLVLLLRHDQLLPANAVHVLVHLLAHDALAMRKIAIKAVAAILLQQKRKHKKIPVDLAAHGIDVTAENGLLSLPPGNRPDNEWLLHYSSNAPKTEEEWNTMQFVDKTHWGFYTWPRKLLTYARKEDQPPLERKREQLSEEEREVYDAFVDPTFVSKVASFLSLEDKKGKDTYSMHRFHLFRGLFRNLDTTILPLLKEALNKLVDDNQESSHRCASEIISGLVRGSKHWEYSQIQDLWSYLIPLLKKAFSNIIPEALNDWTTALVTSTESRDPRRMNELFEFLLANPINGDGGAFGDAGRLFIAQSTVVQQEWRAVELNHRLLKYIQPHFAHPYKSVRDRIGSVLSYLLMFDVKFGKCTSTLCPRVEQFVDSVIGDLTLLNEETQSSQSTNSIEKKTVNAEVAQNDIEMVDVSEEEAENRKRAVKIAKTDLQCCLNLSDDTFWTPCRRLREDVGPVLVFLSSQPYTMQPLSESIFRLLPALMPLESRDDDPELQEYCKYVFKKLPQLQLADRFIPIVVSTLKQVSDHRSWNVRRLVLRYLQAKEALTFVHGLTSSGRTIRIGLHISLYGPNTPPMVVHNLFTLRTESLVSEIRDLVLRLLEDEQLEVREEAANALSGLVHYGFVVISKDLQAKFYSMAKTKLRKVKRGVAVSAEDQVKDLAALQRRHAGVLGFSACIQAFPYDVPEWMPEMLLVVGDHLHDPAIIQATAKKTLSEFKRTHHDNWQLHKQQFTDDQLSILTDLLISPSYYA